MKARKILIALIVMVLCSSCLLFADVDLPSKFEFKLSHNVNVNKKLYFEFWDPSTNGRISSKEISTNEKTVFATLVIFYNTKITLTDISVSFTDLVNAESGDYCPYTMEVLTPNQQTSYATVVPTSGKHGAGTCSLLDTNKTFKKYTSNAFDTDEVVDFAITIDDSDVAVGSYTGNITFTYTSN